MTVMIAIAVVTMMAFVRAVTRGAHMARCAARAASMSVGICCYCIGLLRMQLWWGCLLWHLEKLRGCWRWWEVPLLLLLLLQQGGDSDGRRGILSILWLAAV